MLQPHQLSVRRLVAAAARWPVTSQQQARRNALVATTALTQRRMERLDVEDYLAGLTAPGAADQPEPETPRRARRHTA